MYVRFSPVRNSCATCVPTRSGDAVLAQERRVTGAHVSQIHGTLNCVHMRRSDFIPGTVIVEAGPELIEILLECGLSYCQRCAPQGDSAVRELERMMALEGAEA